MSEILVTTESLEYVPSVYELTPREILINKVAEELSVAQKAGDVEDIQRLQNELLNLIEGENRERKETIYDAVNHPKHYTSHPSGIECIAVTEHMNFNIGNAIKYLWRTEHKNGIEDIRKAIWYLNREIERLEKA